MTERWDRVTDADVIVRLAGLEPIFVDGSLHVDEFHLIDKDGTTYRYFVPSMGRDHRPTPDTEFEVMVANHPFDGKPIDDLQSWEKESERFRREIQKTDGRHFHICRTGDRFAEVIEAMTIDPKVKAEVINQIIAIQRLAMTLNKGPGERGCSPHKLNRF